LLPLRKPASSHNACIIAKSLIEEQIGPDMSAFRK
jgi:hypothetical protein